MALVVTPVATVTEHSVFAANVADAAVSVKVAVGESEFAPPAVKVVEPHPVDLLIPDGVLTKTHVGNSNAMLSEASNGALSLNEYVTAEGRCVKGSAMTNLLSNNAGATVAVDLVICAAPILATAASLSVTATVREARFAACAAAAVVTPVAIVTLHCT